MSIKRIFSALVCAAILVGFTACDKKNEPNNEDKTPSIQHEAVDLGLSVLWATCNVGANSPEESGDLFAWGETKPKENYSWDNYIFGTPDNITKYLVENDEYGATGTIDNKITLELIDDAAAVNWGGNWRIPTRDEIKELVMYCTWTWTDNYNGTGAIGCVVTSKKNSNSIFLPAASEDEELGGICGFYWSSSLELSQSFGADMLCFESDNECGCGFSARCFGHSVRAVCEPK